MKEKLLENPNYLKLRKFALKIPVETRNFLKAKKFPALFDYLKWILIDEQRPRYFHPYGLYFFTGLPGTGKTIFMTYELEKYREQYGDSILIGTNYGYKNQDFVVKGYEDIIKLRDKPTIIGYDEIQNDFDSRNWANLDSAFSERITQSRKLEGLMILATAQKFSFVDKRLRQLTHMVYECRTFKNRLTIAKLFEPELKEKIEEGQYTETVGAKSRGFKYFVQSDGIRDLYSSYQILLHVLKDLEEYNNSSDRVLDDIRGLLTESSPY